MKCLITGGSGFIATNLKGQLLKDGHDVITLDLQGNSELIGDITDYEFIKQSTQDVDCIFHMAAITSPPEFELYLMKGFQTNVNGTLNILKAASVNSVPRVVLASSSAIYGSINSPGLESFTPLTHGNMYSLTKLIDEYLGRFFSIRNETSVVSLRFFNTYGIGENVKGLYSSVISKFLDSVKKNENPNIFGDGTQSRDFIYVKDLVSAISRFMKNGVGGEVYNVGSGISTSFNNIIKTISEVLGREIKPVYQKNPYRNYQYFTNANMDKTLKEIPWKAKYNLKDGIFEMAKEMELI